MRRLPMLSAAVLLLAATTAGSAVAQGTAGAAAQGTPKLKWGPASDALPPGATVAVVDGDPSASGPFTVRLRMPAGYRIAPHSHPSSEEVTVIRGGISFGMGETWDNGKMRTLRPGASMTTEAGQPHYVRARSRTELEVRGTGPFQVTYVNPNDDPRNKKQRPAKPKA